MPTRLFKILEEGILPRVSHRKGRPGAVEDPGVLKQGLGYDLDHLHELVNETVRKFLDHGDIRDNTRYRYRTVLENVSHLTPEVLEKVSQLVAESGHAMVRKSGKYKSGKVPCGAAAIRLWWSALPDGRQPAVGCDALSGARPRSRARGGGGSGSIGAAG